jgi:O-acetyl-ADP-ribose deacetylase (regulator of RNase III)
MDSPKTELQKLTEEVEKITGIWHKMAGSRPVGQKPVVLAKSCRSVRIPAITAGSSRFPLFGQTEIIFRLIIIFALTKPKNVEIIF